LFLVVVVVVVMMALAIDCALFKAVVGVCEVGGGGCKTGAAYKRAKEKGGQEID